MAITIQQHFQTITIPGDDAMQRPPPEVGKWVAKGTLLLSKAELPGSWGSRKSKRSEVKIGANVEFDGSDRVVAATAGYPRVTVSVANDAEVHRVELEPLVDIDRQGMLAKLNIYPAVNVEDVPTREDIEAIFKEAGGHPRPS